MQFSRHTPQSVLIYLCFRKCCYTRLDNRKFLVNKLIAQTYFFKLPRTPGFGFSSAAEVDPCKLMSLSSSHGSFGCLASW